MAKLELRLLAPVTGRRQKPLEQQPAGPVRGETTIFLGEAPCTRDWLVADASWAAVCRVCWASRAACRGMPQAWLTMVPTLSLPSKARMMLPGVNTLNTTMGMWFSLHRVIAVSSITCRWRQEAKLRI